MRSATAGDQKLASFPTLPNHFETGSSRSSTGPSHTAPCPRSSCQNPWVFSTDQQVTVSCSFPSLPSSKRRRWSCSCHHRHRSTGRNTFLWWSFSNHASAESSRHTPISITVRTRFAKMPSEMLCLRRSNAEPLAWAQGDDIGSHSSCGQQNRPTLKLFSSYAR